MCSTIMATETAQPRPQARKPYLLGSIDAFQEVVSTAVILPKEDGVISVSEDRTIRVWLKRDSGQYWPSVFHTMPSTCSCMSFNPETRRLSVGMDTGSICEFILFEDYNKMIPARTYQAHQGRVSVVLFVLEMEWLLSTGQDKNLTWHCSESGQQLGTYRTMAFVSGLQFDIETRHAFVGDQSGQVTILKLEQDSCSLVTTFKGHTGNVTALCWDPVQRVLFSGSSDHSIIMWDIGGRKGTAIELQGHKHQSGWTATHVRSVNSRSSGTLSRCGTVKRLAFDSTTAGNVARPCVVNALLSAPPSHSWVLNLRCECAMSATSPLLTRTEHPQLPFTTASTALFTCTMSRPQGVCSPLAPTRSSRYGT
ncbi:WD repeat and FYVE domain-containing protein 2 isoform X3 [Gouania willdenowi]|uniref:WD repeat and FYVE domain-containing protein 2 isoform X3 n=1 Tax=Gouania willdenowi TaxID=441366 RepID=UPI00105451CD|nr:WD repeat and FYVE domain-containing protein 2 isoform X3 [Gouania willdenowi]